MRPFYCINRFKVSIFRWIGGSKRKGEREKLSMNSWRKEDRRREEKHWV
jgi:hypothetical protein